MNDQAALDKPLSRWWVVPMLLVGGAAAYGVSRVGPVAQAEAAGITAAVFAVCFRTFWDIRHTRWVWQGLFALVVAHVALILLFPWSRNHHLAKADLNFVWIDWLTYFLMGLALDWLNRRTDAKPNGSYPRVETKD